MSAPVFKPPQLRFAPLPYPEAQGSAELSHAGYTVLASANGPIDAPARAQQPEEATIEVNVRENVGGGGPRERHLERLLLQTLKPLIDVRAHPRTMIQITLQVLRTPRDAVTTTPVGQAETVAAILPTLVNVSVAALLDANVSMTGVAVAVGIVTSASSEEDEDEEMHESKINIINDSKAFHEVAAGAALHVFAYTGKGELLLAISERACDVNDWQEAASVARETCCGRTKAEDGMIGWLRQEISEELSRRRRWKQDQGEG